MILRQKNCEIYIIKINNEKLKELIRDFAKRKQDNKFEFLKFK